MATFLVASLITAFAAVVQASTGIGFGMIALPLLAYMMPQHLPQVLLLHGFVLSVAMVHVESAGGPAGLFHGFLEVRSIIIGRVLGTIPGVLVVATLGVTDLKAVFAVVILLSVAAMSARRATLPVTPTTSALAGVLSGVMGTVASVGGPPIALLFVGQSGRELRAAIGWVMLIGTGTSVAGLALSGAMTWEDTTIALALLPSLAAGLAISRLVTRYVDAGRLRPVVMTVITLSALGLLAQAFLER